MATRCYNKPNRTRERTFTARDVGRIACAAVQDGVTRRDLQREIARCVPNEEIDCEKIRSFIPIIISVATAAIVLLRTTQPVLVVIRQILLAGAVLWRLLPASTRLQIEGSVDDILTLENQGRTIEGEFTRLIDELRQIKPPTGG